MWLGDHQGRQVAVKVLRVYLSSDFDKITHVGCLCGVQKVRMDELTMTFVGFLQRSCDVENSSPSERFTSAGSDNG